MPVTFTSGDPLLTSAQTLAFGYNVKGRVEVDALATALNYRYPVAFASFSKQCRGGRINAGDLWLWRDSRPLLLFLVIRESPVGITRPRYVDGALMTLARDYRLYGLESVALAPLTAESEWETLKPIVERWLNLSALPVTVYERYLPGVAGEDETG